MRAVYLGAMSDGKVMHRGSSVDCHQRWQEMLKGTEMPAISPLTTPASTSSSTGLAESVRNAAIVGGIREALTALREKSDGAPDSLVAVIENLKDWFVGG